MGLKQKKLTTVVAASLMFSVLAAPLVSAAENPEPVVGDAEGDIGIFLQKVKSLEHTHKLENGAEQIEKHSVTVGGTLRNPAESKPVAEQEIMWDEIEAELLGSVDENFASVVPVEKAKAKPLVIEKRIPKKTAVQTVAKDEKKAAAQPKRTENAAVTQQKVYRIQFGADTEPTDIKRFVEKAKKNGINSAKVVTDRNRKGLTIWHARAEVSSVAEAKAISSKLSSLGLRNYMTTATVPVQKTKNANAAVKAVPSVKKQPASVVKQTMQPVQSEYNETQAEWDKLAAEIAAKDRIAETLQQETAKQPAEMLKAQRSENAIETKTEKPETVVTEEQSKAENSDTQKLKSEDDIAVMWKQLTAGMLPEESAVPETAAENRTAKKNVVQQSANAVPVKSTVKKKQTTQPQKMQAVQTQAKKYRVQFGADTEPDDMIRFVAKAKKYGISKAKVVKIKNAKGRNWWFAQAVTTDYAEAKSIEVKLKSIGFRSYIIM